MAEHGAAPTERRLRALVGDHRIGVRVRSEPSFDQAREPIEARESLLLVGMAKLRRVERAQGVWEAVEQEEAALAGRGRVLIRPSGTEPVVRVMVEAPDERECEDVTARLVAAVERELGAP